VFWAALRKGLVSAKSGIATVTGKALRRTDFLLLSVQIQIGSIFPQPNHKSNSERKKKQ
jgi:hypothetical protein